MKQEKIDEYLNKLEEINKNEHKDYSIDVETITRANEKAKFFVTYNNEKIEFEMTPHNFFNNGYRLPKGLRRRRSQEEYEKKVFDLVQNEYEVIGRYTGSTKKIKIKHNKCGRIYEVAANEFLQGKRCAQCSQRMKLNTEIFKERVREQSGDEYQVVGEYITSLTPIEILHKKCNNSFLTNPTEFTGKRQRRCPFCNGLKSGISKCAKIIQDILSELNVEFEREKRFFTKDEKRIQFDFALSDNLFIEFDGIQHFIEDHNFLGKSHLYKDSLDETQRRDDRKNSWVIENNKYLLRIPYTTSISCFKIIIEEFLKLNDQSQDVEEIRKRIFETKGLLIYNYQDVRYDLTLYRKEREKKK